MQPTIWGINVSWIYMWVDVSLVDAGHSSTSSPGVSYASATISSSPGVVSKAPLLKRSPSAPVILKKPVRMLNGEWRPCLGKEEVNIIFFYY